MMNKKQYKRIRRLFSTAWNRYIKRPVETALYWLRTHTINRYHMIDIRSAEYGYSWGWIDRDEVLLLASFKILRDFVEEEEPYLGHFDPDPVAGITQEYCDSHNHSVDEVNALYRWWTEERKREWDGINNMWCSDSTTAHLVARKLEDRLREKDSDQLSRLIKIRKFLWT